MENVTTNSKYANYIQFYRQNNELDKQSLIWNKNIKFYYIQIIFDFSQKKKIKLEYAVINGEI